MDSIKVAVRVRPQVEAKAAPEDSKRIKPPSRNLVKVVDDQMVHLEPRSDGKTAHDFCFDHVFGGEACQTTVFENTAKPMIESLMDGYSATVFAYGATGCGKTFTVTGTQESPGLIPLSVERLFQLIDDSRLQKATKLSLSYLEIYNEKIQDLLCPGSTLKLHEISTGVDVAGLSQHEPQNVDEVTQLILKGNERRTQSPTAANAESSRSHAILQIRLLQTDTSSGIEEEQCMSTLSIIDLAGSERASTTQNEGKQLKEGAAINRSLLALGRCISALSSSKQFIPYRESNLTRLLKFSLGGNCKTLMIACVSPNASHYDDTFNTLTYAKQATQIKTRASRTTTTVSAKITEFRAKIEQQSKVITELQKQVEDGDQVMLKYAKRLLAGEAPDHVLAMYRNEPTWTKTKEQVLGFVERGSVESPSKRMRAIPMTPVRGPIIVPGSVKRVFTPGDVSFDTSINQSFD